LSKDSAKARTPLKARGCQEGIWRMRLPLGYVGSLCGDDSHEACGCGSGKVHMGILCLLMGQTSSKSPLHIHGSV